MKIRDKNRFAPEAQAGIADEFAVEIKPDLEKLRVYTRTKLALADQLRIIREALRALGLENGERHCEELMVKLAEDRFTLAVLGQFKRGKSSLMNAVIGRELLPTGVLPLTSARWRTRRCDSWMTKRRRTLSERPLYRPAPTPSKEKIPSRSDATRMPP